jgi:hypothetical protein
MRGWRAGLTDFLGDKRIRDLSAAWHHMIGNVIAVWSRRELVPASAAKRPCCPGAS